METKINKLTVHGFKSFKKNISVPLLSGFNAVAGPNGSGKSNILDAICFVLGRTSAKSMRADKLHELVFHGNKNIPASDHASVTMWLDNTKKIFPFEMPEISINRRVNKKGNSVYKVNGKTTTREKVLELFSSAMIHPDGFNIIMQGDVTGVVEMSHEERRGIIDHAAGISLYDEKRDKAQKNLDIVGDKLREVEIILTDRLERLQDLEQDRNTALKYQKLIDHLKVLNASLAHKKLESEKKKFNSIEDQIKENEKIVKDSEGKIKSIEKEIDSLDKRRQELTEKIFVRSKEAGIKQELEDIKNKIIRNKDRIESNEREISRTNKLIDRLKKSSRITTTKPVQTVLDMKRSGVLGRISDLFKTSSDYSIATQVAGGSRLNNLVVKNANIATECINYLKNEKIGRATFLPLDRIKYSSLTPEQKMIVKKPGVVGLVTDLIKYDPEHSSAIKHVFGNTVVVENLGVAREIGIGKIRMVTLDGDLVERSGAMIGGFYRKIKATTSDVELEEYEQAKQELDEEINFLRIEVGQLNTKMDNLRTKLDSESQNVIDLENEKVNLDEKLVRLRNERNSIYEQRIELTEQMNKLKIKGAKTEAEMSNFQLEVQRYENIEYLDEKPDVLEDKIDSTNSELNSLGLVNLKAIDEYDKFKGEFDELKNKFDAIQKEKESIESMIEQIEGKKKDVFYECLKVINKNFKDIFMKLSSGDASLELEDPLDITSGLIIKANPSGKRLLNLDSMSGGEKTMTALAFLFSVQKYKPAPFYVLDEVDAALDKTNTKRISDMIKKLSENEQFLVITHNDYTIKTADRVYGVSMIDGESKILGIELPKGE